MAKQPEIEMQKVNKSTYLMLVDGTPRRVYSTASNLDDAYDAACTFYGQHLEGGAWATLVTSFDAREFGDEIIAKLPLNYGSDVVWSLSVGDE